MALARRRSVLARRRSVLARRRSVLARRRSVLARRRSVLLWSVVGRLVGRLVGCFFHWAQLQVRWLGKLKLMKYYKNVAAGRRLIRALIGLAYIPPKDSRTMYGHLKAKIQAELGPVRRNFLTNTIW